MKHDTIYLILKNYVAPSVRKSDFWIYVKVLELYSLNILICYKFGKKFASIFWILVS